MPVERKPAPMMEPMRPLVTEKSSWMRRRRRRSLKKSFQLSDGVAEAVPTLGVVLVDGVLVEEGVVDWAMREAAACAAFASVARSETG